MTTKTTEPDKLIEEVEELLAKATPPCGCGSKHCNGKTELNGLRFVCASEYGMNTAEYHIDDPESALYESAPELLRRLVEQNAALQSQLAQVTSERDEAREKWNRYAGIDSQIIAEMEAGE